MIYPTRGLGINVKTGPDRTKIEQVLKRLTKCFPFYRADKLVVRKDRQRVRKTDRQMDE